MKKFIYFINKKTDNIERISFSQKTTEAYRNIYFKNLKEADKFKKYIYKTTFDRLGLENSNKYVERNFHLLKKRESLFNEIKILDKILQKYPQYKRGFFESSEWKERKRLNSLYKYYSCLWNMCLVESRESIQREVVKNTNGELSGTSYKYAGAALYNNKFVGNYNTQKIREIAKIFQNQTVKNTTQINKIQNDYKNLNSKTQLLNDNLYKNKIIKIYTELQKIDMQIEKNFVNILISIPNQKKLIEKQVKDMKVNDILRDENYNYNIYYYKKDILLINIVGIINDRLGILDEQFYLLRNNDSVIINSEFDGVSLDLPNKTFFNRDELSTKKIVVYSEKDDPLYKKIYNL